MAAALSQAFFFKGTCVWLRKYVHHQKGRQEYCGILYLKYNAYCRELTSFSKRTSSKGVFFLKCYALAHSIHQLLSENLFLKDVDAAYLWGRLLFFEEDHLFKTLLAGNAARVQVNRWDRTHIPLWTIAVLCNSSYKSCWFHITCSSTASWLQTRY